MDKTLLKIQQKNIPVSWRVERFGDVFDFLSTATYSRDILKESGEVQYLHYGDIHTKYNFHLDFTKNNLPFIKEIERRNYPYMKNGDLVLADASEDYDGVGKGVEIKNLGDSKAISGLHTFLLRDKDSNFVLGYKGFIPSCDVVREQFYRFATGTKVYSLSKESLSNVKVLIPPKEEQKAIADCLSTWDDAIEKQTKLIAAKQQRKKALMQQLLSGKKRLPGFTEDWKEVRLGEVLSKFQNGYAFDAKKYKSSGIPIVTMGNINLNGDFYFNSAKLNYWNEDSILSRYLLQKGSLIMAMTDVTPSKNLIGLCTKIDIKGKFYLNQRVGLLIPDEKKVKPQFLAYLSQMPKWRNQCKAFATLGVQANLGTSDIKKIKILLPSISEQSDILAILITCDKEIYLSKKQLEFIKLQKKANMQVLLSGRRRLIV